MYSQGLLSLFSTLLNPSLRHVHQLGLKADVMAMTGGRIWHVANAERDDPGMEDIKDIIVVAGQNDINAPYQTNHGYAYGVDKGIKKLLKVREGTPEKVITFMHVQPPLTARPRILIRAKYLQKRLGEIQNDMTQVVIASTHEVEHDKTDHPTLKGTAELLSVMDKEGSMKIIKRLHICQPPKLYQGVQSTYQYDCPSCHKLGIFEDELGCCLEYCPECYTVMMEYNSPEISRLEKQSKGPHPSQGNQKKKRYEATKNIKISLREN